MWVVLTSATKKIYFSENHTKKHFLFYVVDFSPKQTAIVKLIVCTFENTLSKITFDNALKSIPNSFETMPFNRFTLGQFLQVSSYENEVMPMWVSIQFHLFFSY